jgi:hypothetical protein
LGCSTTHSGQGQAELSLKTILEVKKTTCKPYEGRPTGPKPVLRQQWAFCATISASDELTRLVDQLFNSSEKRLARTLLLLARYGKEDKPHRLLPKIPQETLAEMVGTTRSRVNFFMNKFRKLGFIKYNGGLQINTSLLNVVLHD